MAWAENHSLKLWHDPVADHLYAAGQKKVKGHQPVVMVYTTYPTIKVLWQQSK